MNPPRRLPLAEVVAGAFVLPWRHRMEVLRHAGVPMAAVILLALLTQTFGAAGILWAYTLSLLTMAAIAWLAIVLHRLVLLDAPGSPLNFDAVALRRFVIFLLASVVVFVAYHGLRLLLFSGAVAMMGSAGAAVGESGQELPVSSTVLDNVISAGAWILLGRLSMIFPALATDDRIDTVDLWRMSRGNALRLAVVAGVLPAGLSLLTGQLARLGLGHGVLTLLAVLMTLGIVVQVTALSLSYRALRAPGPRPSDRPD
jgi:hypothetical protein